MPLRSGILAFVLGVIGLQWQANLPVLSLALVLLPLVIGVVVCWHSRKRFVKVIGQFFFIVLLLGCGFFWAAIQAHWRLADELPKDWEGKDIQLIGVVSSLPQFNDIKIRFQFDVEQVLTPQAHVPRRISLSWYKSRTSQTGPTVLPNLNAGERWKITVRLKRPHGNANPHGFDYERWAFERNIRAGGYVRDANDNIRLDVMVGQPAYWIEKTRQQIQNRFKEILHDRPYAGVLMTLATGDQRAIASTHWQVFTHTGTNHLMAISGLHITLVASLVYALVFVVWRSHAVFLLRLPARRAAVLAAVVAALGYALLSGFAVPAQRAFLMLAVLAVALWFNWRLAPSAILALALFTVVFIDPWAVLSAGFWLSFGAVAIIMLVTVGRLGVTDTVTRLLGWLRIQWAITLGLVPLLLILFQQFSLVSPLANAIAIPLVSMIIVPLTLLATIPWLDFLLPVAHEVLRFVMGFLQWLNDLPQPVWQQHKPPFWTIPVAIAGICWLLLPGSLGFGFFSGFPARWLGLVALLPVFLIFPERPPEKAVWITVLDVGQGLAMVVQTQNHTLLFDTGPSFGESNSGNRVILPFLRAEGIRRLDKMIVSHADSDHSGGAQSILDGIPVEIFLSSLDESQVLAQSDRLITGENAQCQAGQRWDWDGVVFEILHPDVKIYQNLQRKTNPSSCVLKITSAYGSILMPADIYRQSEKWLLEHFSDKLPSTVLVAPHHGSLTSSSKAFLRAVNPELTVFTVGYLNRFGHPHPEVIERYRILGSILLRSDWHGAVQVRFEREGVSFESWRQKNIRYWHQKMPSLDTGNS